MNICIILLYLVFSHNIIIYLPSLLALAQRKLVVLFMLPKHLSKIGTLILLNPQSVKFLCAAVSFTNGLNFFVLRSVYVSNIASFV